MEIGIILMIGIAGYLLDRSLGKIIIILKEINDKLK